MSARIEELLREADASPVGSSYRAYCIDVATVESNVLLAERLLNLTATIAVASQKDMPPGYDARFRRAVLDVVAQSARLG